MKSSEFAYVDAALGMTPGIVASHSYLSSVRADAGMAPFLAHRGEKSTDGGFMTWTDVVSRSGLIGYA